MKDKLNQMLDQKPPVKGKPLGLSTEAPTDTQSEIAQSHNRTIAPTQQLKTSAPTTPKRTKRGYAFREDLVKACKQIALDTDRLLYEVMEEALTKYLEGDSRIAALEAEVQQLRERLLGVEAQPAIPSHVEQKTQPRPKVEAPPLPDDLIPLLTFSNQHFVSHNEANRLRGTGSIKVVKGTWTIGKQIVKIALDAKGRRDFWVQFHEAPGFRSCDECPHTIGP